MCKKSGKMPKNILYIIFFRLVIIKKTTKFAGEKIKSTVVDDGNTIFFTLLILKYLGIKGGFIKVRPFFFFGNQWLEKNERHSVWFEGSYDKNNKNRNL